MSMSLSISYSLKDCACSLCPNDNFSLPVTLHPWPGLTECWTAGCEGAGLAGQSQLAPRSSGAQDVLWRVATGGVTGCAFCS